MSIFQKVTLKTLKENKTRTIVTIIGIILSLSMFTAVTTSISSFQHHLLTVAKVREGDWHVCVPAASNAPSSLPEQSAINAASFLEQIGYAKLKDGSNPDKPYLFLGGMDANAEGILPLLVTDGRLPKTDSELLIPEHLAYNGNVVYQLGDTITLEVGHRTSRNTDGTESVLWQDTPYLYTEEEQLKMRKSKAEADGDDVETDSDVDENDAYTDAEDADADEDHALTDAEDADTDSDADEAASSSTDSDRDALYETEPTEVEAFETDFTKTYTVVGFYSRPSIEKYDAPGYTALTISGERNASLPSSYTAYLRFQNPKDALPWLGLHYSDVAGTDSNSDLLRMYAASYESSYNQVLYGLGAILILIILFGSISLIYNAFSISVTERTKQFGLLASLGATKKQLVHSVLFEAFALCIIGIPLGILAGVAGIGITFSFVGSSMSKILWGDLSVALTLHATPWAILIASLIGLGTVLISAYLPARRSAKLSPIEAIRMTSDIAIRPGKVRTMKLTYRLFGLSGMLASKNFKRNRRKYRATVLSLFVSVVLFISASSFCSYLLKGAESIISDSGFDIVYYRYSHTAGDADDPDEDSARLSDAELLKQLSALEKVEYAAYVKDMTSSVTIPRSSLSEEYRAYLEQIAEEPIQSDSLTTSATLLFIDDSSFASYLAENGIQSEDYLNVKQPPAIVFDFVRMYHGDSDQYSAFHTLNGKASSLELLRIEPQQGYRYVSTYISDEEELTSFFESKSDSSESFLELPVTECSTPVPITIGAMPEQAPFFLGERFSNGLTLVYPIRAMEAVIGPAQMEGAAFDDNVEFYFQAADHAQATSDISELLTELGLSNNAVYDYAESAAQQRSMFMIITVFSYGFIILISLIAIANVFNTISTNIQLRKREFAMLKSTGMTPKGFRVMMCYECLLYGVKSLLFGLPVSLLVTYRIYRSVSAGWATGFYVPWYSLFIAIGSVFLVVGSTMIYSMHKIGRENIMDHLKNENA